MRILYISPEPPSLTTGGGRHSYANLRALCEFPGARVDYIGPPIDGTLPGLAAVHVRASRPYRVSDKLYAALTRSATSLAGLARSLRDAPVCSVAFVDSSKAAFALEALAGAPLLVSCVRNVEADYMAVNSRGLSRLAAFNVRKSEAATLRLSDRVLLMHEPDLGRLAQLYAVDDLCAKAHLHPVCAFDPQQSVLPLNSREGTMLIPGSLDQRFNEEGILAFLDQCWPRVSSLGSRLVIAGRHPRAALRHRVQAAGALLIADPPDMATLLRHARVVIVPDIFGAGMKLRVAEAMSYGVPVVGTTLGLRGYAGIHDYGYAVPAVSDMTEPLVAVATNAALATQLARGARAAWLEHYSYAALSTRLHGWLREWLGL